MNYVLDFSTVTRKDVNLVGGKNAYLGDMINNLTSLGVKVPPGCAVTTEAYRLFLKENDIEKDILEALSQLNVEDLDALKSTSRKVRDLILKGTIPEVVQKEVEKCYHKITDNKHQLAVRSSATAEDMPEASFAGQQETYLNVVGFPNVLEAIKNVYASLFTERAISYRTHHNIPHHDVAISVGLQKMIRSDLGSSGVIFTIDTESGFEDVIFITATYGLGEIIVQGKVNPDEYYVHKPTFTKGFHSIISRKLGTKDIKMVYSENAPSVTVVDVSIEDKNRFCLTDDDLLTLTKHAMEIEKFYGYAMDIEWAKDGIDGELYVVQARPETVKSRKQTATLSQYTLLERSNVLTSGSSVGQKIGQGRANVILNIEDKHLIKPGDILVTASTDPDWEPIMKQASGIVTDHGGRTCHAAIVARELGIPAIVGCKNATEILKTGTPITLACEGEKGIVYEGLLKFKCTETDVLNLPKIPVKIMMNIANPEQAFALQSTPNEGVGLARVEFIIGNNIGVHPNAALNYETLSADLKQKIQKVTSAYSSPREFYTEKLAEGIATIAAAFYPKPVIVRFSDFKTNEYINLIGGEKYEPHEENPMLGYRGAYRYITDDFKACFDLECEAIKRVRNKKGLKNVYVMVPFVRTLKEAEQVLNLLKSHGLESNKDDLKIYMMCEIPSNAILAEEFLQLFDGFSIGSNDLTQLTLGLDRDSEHVAAIFDERNDAIKILLKKVISTCTKAKKYIGICGQGPSDHLDFAKWLVSQGIESISLNPDTILKTWLALEDECRVD